MLRSPLHSRHGQLGASFTGFAGWEMPLQYSSALAEHHAVRSRAGLFDLSHMGEVRVSGPGALEALNRTFVGDISRLRIGRAKYTMLCDHAGGILDDLIVYRLGDSEFLVVPNAANVAVGVAAMDEGARGLEATVEDRTAATALIAVQGPAAQDILIRALEADGQSAAPVRDVRYYAEVPVVLGGMPAICARTGYTGEDGFELFLPWEAAGGVWDLLMEAGGPAGLVPAGLAARDSLRLEAGMPLCGHELTSETMPYQVGLGRVVALGKPQDFPGRAALERAAREQEAGNGPSPVLVGLSADTRRPLREGFAVLRPASPDDPGTRVVGTVTSGIFSPTLGHAIAMALVDAAVAAPGTALSVDVRGRGQPADVVPLPFLRRERR
ncbi:glycine cleavage system aminomethyltransferase GcvT [Schaalia naturae]|uniref:Aminomethyltransferase n=1 Tax=Schaalia naturae TaxID=635203 RepID=A0ABW2SP15_9ACTO